MSEEFLRTKMLIGKEALNKLKNSRVAVFGIGGVGSYVVEALVRCGIGNLDLIDDDIINLTNINRQIIALHSTVGKLKVDVAKERVLDINSNVKINTFPIFYNSETSKDFDFTKYDYIVDAIDTISAKIELVLNANNVNVPIISSMGTGNKMNPTGFEVTDIYKTSVCPLARVMRQELRKCNIKSLKVVYSKEKPLKPAKSPEQDPNVRRDIPGSNAFVPSVAGLIIASEVIKDLTGFKNDERVN